MMNVTLYQCRQILLFIFQSLIAEDNAATSKHVAFEGHKGDAGKNTFWEILVFPTLANF